MSGSNQFPSRPGKKSAKKLPDGTMNPYRGSPRTLFLGQKTAQEKESERLADEWDAAHPEAE